MASIGKDKNGRRRILFVASDGKRQTLRLGPASKRTALDVKRMVERLLEARGLNRPMEADLIAWLADLDATLTKRLAKVGLIDAPEAKATATLGPFLASYLAKRTDVKESTSTAWRQTERSLLAYFGAVRPLASITAGEAADWARWLLTGAARENRYGDVESDEGLAKNTARKRIRNAKQFFADAVSRDLLTKNPFDELSGTVGGNRTRDYFITRAEAEAVLKACPDLQWRLLFALSRYGGLRCPSEHLALTWADVDLPGGRLTVHSPKTEHHEGGELRVIPIFPELRPYLEQAWDEAPEGTQHVITRYRDTNANLRTTLYKIIKRAKLTPWPKLFHNLRATRETELAETYPMHVVCKWIGNSAKVATAHYLQVTDAHYTEAAQNAAQCPAVAAREAPYRKPAMPIIPGGYDTLRYCTPVQVGPPGLEPGTKGL